MCVSSDWEYTFEINFLTVSTYVAFMHCAIVPEYTSLGLSEIKQKGMLQPLMGIQPGRI